MCAGVKWVGGQKIGWSSGWAGVWSKCVASVCMCMWPKCVQGSNGCLGSSGWVVKWVGVKWVYAPSMCMWSKCGQCVYVCMA